MAFLGIYLLLAVRKPSAHRSLIAFTAWSSVPSCHGDGGAGNAWRDSAHRSAAGSAADVRHRRSSDCPGSSKAARSFRRDRPLIDAMYPGPALEQGLAPGVNLRLGCVFRPGWNQTPKKHSEADNLWLK